MAIKSVFLKLCFLITLMLGASSALASYPSVSNFLNVPSADPRDQIIGEWKFVAYIYQGQTRLPLNPNLVLLFKFNLDGTDTVYWTRKGEPGFCERKGFYSVEEGFLHDEVIWINPKNNMDCGQDPDMRIGKKSINPVRFINGQFHLELELSGEPFIYVFDPYVEQAPVNLNKYHSN